MTKTTKAELLAMPPGPELDREMEVLLNGFADFPYHPISTDADIALLVWQDRCADEEWKLIYIPTRKVWWFYNEERDIVGTAPTPAHAICRAIIEEIMK